MPPTPEPQFFKDLSLEWMEAWKSRDKQKLDLLIAEDFFYISRMVKGMCVGKKEWIRMAMDLFEVVEYEIRFIRIQVQERSAIVFYTLTTKIRPDHTGEAVKQIVTDVWTCGDPGWQAMSRQPVQL